MPKATPPLVWQHSLGIAIGYVLADTLLDWGEGRDWKEVVFRFFLFWGLSFLVLRFWRSRRRVND